MPRGILESRAPDILERVARDAVGRAEETDDLNMRADALLDLGRVLSEAGDRDGAVFAVEQALSLYEAKGNSAAVAAARRRLGEIGGSADAGPV